MARKTETKWVIGVDDNASKKLAKISGSFRALGKQTEAVGKSLSRNLTAPILAAVGGLGALGKSAVTSADKMKKLSTRLGISVKALSEFKFIAAQSGIEFNTFTMGLQRMTRRVAEAALGYGEAKGALAELGVDTMALSKMKPEQQFMTLADSLQGVESSADRVRIAMKLFDSEGVSLLQMMEGGSEAMKIQAGIAQKLGIVINDDLANGAEQLVNKFGVLKNQFIGIGVSIAKFALPYMSQFADRASILIERVKGLSDEQIKFGASVAAVVASIGPVLIIIGKLTQTLPNLVKGFKAVTRTLKLLKFATVQAMLPMLAWVSVGAAVGVALLAIWANWGDNIKTFFVGLWSNVTRLWGTSMDWLKDKSVVVLDALGSAWEWLRDTIFASMKPVLDWILKAYSTVYGFILEGIGKVIQGFGQLLKFVAKAPGAPDWIKDMADDVDSFGESVENMGENLDLGAMATAAFTSIKDAISSGADAVADIDWSGLWSNISTGAGEQTELVKQQFIDMVSALGLSKEKLDQILGGIGLTGDTSGALTNESGSEEQQTNEQGETPEQKLLTWQDLLKDSFESLKSTAEQTADIVFTTFDNIATGIAGVMGDAIGGVMDNMLGLAEGPIMVGRAFKKMAVNVLKNLASMVIKMLVVKAIASALGFSVGPLPSLSSIAGGDLAGAREKGGPVAVGSSYVVGERGPEIFTPKTNGNITANDKIGETSIVNQITINAEGNLLNDPLALRRVAEVLNDELTKVQGSYYDSDLVTA